uniref:Reverse transcriptase domain-containing protein n=1 Tax=Haemonchus contortus TaxID=6289 RepID=A0A7I4YVS2_HAECO
MDLERLYREDHTLFKAIVEDFNVKIGPRRTAEELHIGTHGVEQNEQETVIEALGNQSVPTQYIKMLRELYDNFTTRISPFYKDIIINVKRDDIVLITPNIEQAEQMLAEFDNACGKIGLRLNLMKTMFMKNGLVPDAPLTLNGTNVSECSSYAYLEYRGSSEENKEHPAPRSPFRHCCSSCLTYASETWTLRKQDEHAVSVAQRALERTMLGISLYTQVQKGIWSSELRQRTKIRDAVDYAKKLKIRWAGHVMRYSDDRWTRAVTDWILRDIKRTPGRPPTRWSDFFTEALNERNDFVSLERFIGPLWLVTGTNGDVTGARSRKSTINGTTGDTGDVHRDRRYDFPVAHIHTNTQILGQRVMY